MASPNPSVQTCVLKVNVKCCNACRATAKRKLQSVSGVSAVEYNAEEGLMTVSGDVNPMTLVHKIHKWGKNAELVSVQNQPLVHNSPDNASNTSPSPVLNSPEHKKEEKKKINRRQNKCFLLRCLGMKTSEAKVQPFTSSAPNRNWQFPLRHENGRAWPFTNAAPLMPPPLPPAVYPPPQAMHGGPPPLPYPPPYFGMGQPPAQQHGVGMFRAAPPPSPPYFQSRQPLPPQMVNPAVHYPGY